MPRNLVLFDLEWNIGYKPYLFNYHGVQQTFRGEIIEIGAVKIDEDANVLDTFSIHLRPRIFRTLQHHIAKVTGLTQADLDRGEPIVQGLRRFMQCTFSLGQLQDGRFVAALSDGMGHGNQAALESRQAVELLRMCLDAGYDRAQTLTAVNGMMLLAGQGERFTTVDLFLLDLWTGKASLDKLGAAGSYLMQAEGLSLLGGDALPLGILENVESGEKLMQLHQGDTLILLSDGVEDAYENRQSMEETIRDALTLETAQDAANAILTGAQSGDAAPADDQTVLVLRLIRARADAKIEEMYQ